MGGYYVCIGIPGTPTAKPTTTTGTGNSAPSPTQSGLTSDCNVKLIRSPATTSDADHSLGTAFDKVVSSDTCQKIVDKYSTFTLDTL